MPKKTTKEITKEEEKAIVDSIMAQKTVTPEDEAKKLDEANEEELEKLRIGTSPKGRFVTVEYKGMYRVMNKRQQWVSPFVTLNIASRLCADLNIKDPEQKMFNASVAKKEGTWVEN
jgi:hypothetical protein